MCLPPGRQVNGKIRFNRYMVECEFDTLQQEKGWELSFNRYMVECEYH